MEVWRFTKIGVHPVLAIYRWIFPCKLSNNGGTPIVGNLHMSLCHQQHDVVEFPPVLAKWFFMIPLGISTQIPLRIP